MTDWGPCKCPCPESSAQQTLEKCLFILRSHWHYFSTRAVRNTKVPEDQVMCTRARRGQRLGLRLPARQASERTGTHLFRLVLAPPPEQGQTTPDGGRGCSQAITFPVACGFSLYFLWHSLIHLPGSAHPRLGGPWGWSGDASEKPLLPFWLLGRETLALTQVKGLQPGGICQA